MPSPARSTGTSSGGLDSRMAVVRATGVWMANGSVANDRPAS